MKKTRSTSAITKDIPNYSNSNNNNNNNIPSRKAESKFITAEKNKMESIGSDKNLKRTLRTQSKQISLGSETAEIQSIIPESKDGETINMDGNKNVETIISVKETSFNINDESKCTTPIKITERQSRSATSTSDRPPSGLNRGSTRQAQVQKQIHMTAKLTTPVPNEHCTPTSLCREIPQLIPSSSTSPKSDFFKFTDMLSPFSSPLRVR